MLYLVYIKINNSQTTRLRFDKGTNVQKKNLLTILAVEKDGSRLKKISLFYPGTLIKVLNSKKISKYLEMWSFSY